MVYAYDLWAQMPVKDLYDSQMMATAIAAAKDRYDKSYEQMKNFRNEYGDFMSPFAKDMEVYGKMVGGVHDLVDNALANGVDLYKSPEGRALIGRAINMVDPGLFNRMRANAKVGYAYLDAMQALKKAGKYSQEQEDFDIEKSGETPFDLFSSLGGAMWGRTSPIERTDLGDLTRKYYEKRTPRLLSKEDFNDPRLAGKYKYDPRYNWYGYLDSDLMKVSPGASAGLIGDPRADFFRDQAEKKVIARGELPTVEAVEALFLRDIADANSWALIDPDKKVDEFAKMDYDFRLKNELEKTRHSNAMKEKDASGAYSNIISEATAAKLFAHNTILKSNLSEKDRNTLDSIKDEDKYREFAGKLAIKAWDNYLWNSDKNTPGGSVGSRINHLLAGQKGTVVLNGILSQRAVSGHQIADAQYILPMSGFISGDDGWFDMGETSKVVSAHQIMKNILTYEAPDGTNSKQQLIDKLNDVEEDDYWITNASTKERVERVGAVKPQTADGKGYIVAPDDNGVKHVYMKVRIKLEAKGWDVGSWLPQGEHDGFWVETPIMQTPDGRISLESVPAMYGQEAYERHDLSNAGVSQSYEDARF